LQTDSPDAGQEYELMHERIRTKKSEKVPAVVVELGLKHNVEFGEVIIMDDAQGKIGKFNQIFSLMESVSILT
jgi:hypothetical protein